MFIKKLVLFIVALSISGIIIAAGKLTINQDPQLNDIVYANQNATIKNLNEAVTTSGYRVQIYSSNNAKKAKSDAFELQATLQQMYPDLITHVTYTAPFWKVRIGDFVNYYEALCFSQQLQNDMPKYATGIFVIKDDNITPIQLISTDNNQ